MLSSIRSTVGLKDNTAKLFYLLPKLTTAHFLGKFYATLNSVPTARAAPFLMVTQPSQSRALGTIGHTIINKPSSSTIKEFSTLPRSKRSLLSEFNTQMIDIFVGPHLQHFRLHKKLLCRRIPYFENAVENSMEFPEEHPECFYALFLWVYTEKLPVLSTPPSNKERIKSPWKRIRQYDAYVPNFDILDEIYSTLSARSRPQNYISWVLYSIRRQKSANLLPAVEKMQELMNKHPDLKADFAQYLDKEKAWYEKEKLRACNLQETKKADEQVGKHEEEEHDSGIDLKACTEGFAG
ncbi:hypothetical protein N431DRAFT_497589 [Stipitochalara longipes BDJ]|nr:hypothetical protein N431DRAFT_497589 [Stipitochalara longipes BDJ]